MRTILLVILCVAACKGKGAGGGQSFHDGVQALCDLPDHVPAPGESYEKRLAGVAAWAESNIKNPEVRQLGGMTGNKASLVAAAQKANVAPCKLADNDMALQSFADAMQIVCSAPATADGAYFKGHLLNPDVIKLFSALAEASPADQAAKMQAAITRAGLGGCAIVEKMTARTVEHAPTVTGVHLAELAPRAVTVAASQSGIAVESKPIVAVTNGAVAPGELETVANHTVIKVVDRFLATLAAEAKTHGGALPRVQLVVDPAVPAALLLELVDTADHAGFKDLALVVNADGAARAIPFTRGTGTGAGLQPVAAIAGDKISVYSVSGQEGTAQQPKATVASSTELVTTLAEIVARRFKPGQRTDEDRWITVAVATTVPVQRIAEILAVIRANKDGSELFPRVGLSAVLK